jgi:pSer/pThr/pTyr-binding forkhead associated (FHA) protein
MQTLSTFPRTSRRRSHPRTQPRPTTTATIGRSPDRDFVIDERTVSRHHALIRREGAHWVLVDLGSKNGTRVNGRPVEGRAVIAPGDEIGFGAACARFAPDARRLFSELRVEEPTGA